MTAPSFGSANLQFVAVAPEVVYGTLPATPLYFVPAETPVWTHPTAKLVDTALRGSMAGEYEQVNGMRNDQITFSTNCYIDQVFFFVRSVLGLPDVLTGASDPYTHKTSLQNGNNGQPQSTSVWWYDAMGKAWAMSGAQISSFKLTLATDGLVKIDVTYVGLPAVAITPPANTPTTTMPMPSWNSVITIAGAASQAYSTIDFEIKRATEVIPALTGTQNPFAIFAGPVTVAGSLTAIYQGSTDIHLVDEINNTQPALTVKLSPIGDVTHSITFQFSQTAFDAADPAGAGKWMEIKATTKALANPTDVAGGGSQSPVLATLTSAVSTAI